MEKDIIVNDKKYTLKKWDAISTLNLQIKLTKLLGSALGGVDKISAKDLQNVMQMDIGLLLSNIGGIVEKVDEDKFSKLIQDLLSKNISVLKATESGNEVKVPLVINSLEIMEMYEIAFEVIKFNLGDFINGIKLKLSSRLVQ